MVWNVSILLEYICACYSRFHLDDELCATTINNAKRKEIIVVDA